MKDIAVNDSAVDDLVRQVPADEQASARACIRAALKYGWSDIEFVRIAGARTKWDLVGLDGKGEAGCLLDWWDGE